MQFTWNNDNIRWFQDANEYTGFCKRLADLLAPRLTGYTTMCDVGCGLGFLDLELCNSIEQITCLDISPPAINTLRQTLQDLHITNIEARVMDCSQLTGNWDVIMVTFFSGANLLEFLPHCKKLIAVVISDKAPELTPKKHNPYQKQTVHEVERELQLKGIPYTLNHAAFEFGQPLASVEEAKKFIHYRSPGISQEELAEFFYQRVVAMGDEKFPYFIPRMKPFGVFEIAGELFKQRPSLR